MTRAGFSRDEIYDMLSGIGLPGEQVQLLIDRVAAEFHDAGLEPRPSRLSAEVEIVFERALGKLQHTMLARMDTLAQRLEFAKTELEKLGRRVVELQSIVVQTRRSRSGRKHLATKSSRKSGKW